jgi:hypothetical protein
MLLLTLEPSASDMTSHIDPLSSRLSTLSSTLRTHNRWLPPPSPPKAPEYSIIDIADLSSAISLLETILAQSSPEVSSKRPSPRPFLAKCGWTWDPAWKEFYTKVAGVKECVYLSKWRLNQARGVWEHVSMGGADLGPERAAEGLGCWEDWRWDGTWGEWCLDVSEGDGGEKICVYASRWEGRGDGEWAYVGGLGNFA